MHKTGQSEGAGDFQERRLRTDNHKFLPVPSDPRTPVDLRWGLSEAGILLCDCLSFFLQSFFLKWKARWRLRNVWLPRNRQKGNRTCQSEAAFLPAHWNVSQALGLQIRALSGYAHPSWRALESNVGQAAWVWIQVPLVTSSKRKCPNISKLQGLRL